MWPTNWVSGRGEWGGEGVGGEEGEGGEEGGKDVVHCCEVGGGGSKVNECNIR